MSALSNSLRGYRDVSSLLKLGGVLKFGFFCQNVRKMVAVLISSRESIWLPTARW